MSKILTPYPLPEVWDEDPASDPNMGDLCWWNHPLDEDAGGNVMLFSVGDDHRNPTWAAWEFFDGQSVTVPLSTLHVAVTQLHKPLALQVLADWRQSPTPSPRWTRLTRRGDIDHPDLTQVAFLIEDIDNYEREL